MREVREEHELPLRDETAQPGYRTDPISRTSPEAAVFPQPHMDQWAPLCVATLDLAADQHLPSLLQTIVERAVVLLGAGGGAIGVYDPVREEVDLVGHCGPAVVTDTRQRLGEGMLGLIAATCAPLIGEVQSTIVDCPTGNAESYRARAAMGVPLLYQGHLLGVLSVHEDEESQRHYGAEDVSLLSRFAISAAIAVHNARLLAQARRRADVELEVRVAQRTSELAAANVELQRISRLQEAILNNANYIIVSTDADGIVQTFNAGAERQLGYSAAEVIGRVSPVLFHDPAEVAERARTLQRTVGLTVNSSFDALVALARFQEVDEGEYTMIRRDGSRFQALLSVSALRDATGETVGFLGIGSDITARKQVESVLRTSEEQYRTLVDNSLQGVVIYQNARIVFANAAMAAIAGYSVEELLALEPAQVVRQVHPEDRPLIFPSTILPSDGVETRRVLRLRIMHRDGTVRWVISAAMQISYHGQPARQAVLVDITELKRAEESLLESQRFVDQITETSPNYIFVYDIDQRRDIYINPAAKLFLGYSTEELAALGANFLAAIVHPDDLPAALATFARYPELRDSEYVEQEVRVKSAMGDWHWLLMRESVFKRRPDGRAAQVLGVSMDITALKRSERAMRNALAKERELGELKSRFVSMASHEFRTPLATILAATETLIAYRQRLDDQQTDLRLQRIRRQVQHLSQIIDDVLAMTHVQSGRIEFKPEITDFDAFCREIVEEFQSRSDIAHALDYQSDRSPLVVAIDRKLMRTVVANLLSNAIKYSPKGSSVRVRVTPVEDLVRIEVTDMGIGIPFSDRDHLFEAFYRASNVGATAGTGLGLSIAKEFVELHGGQLAFASELGNATTFLVTIPAVR